MRNLSGGAGSTSMCKNRASLGCINLSSMLPFSSMCTGLLLRTPVNTWFFDVATLCIASIDKLCNRSLTCCNGWDPKDSRCQRILACHHPMVNNNLLLGRFCCEVYFSL